MKKVLLSIILASITATSLGMERVPSNNAPINLHGPINLFGWFNSIDLGNSEQKNNQIRKSYMPYVKIATGLGFASLSIYLGLKEKNETCNILYAAHNGSSGICEPKISSINISTVALAPLVPAYFFMKSGFEDLRMEKKALLKRVNKK